MKKRSRAREVALQYLYQHDLMRRTDLADLAEFVREQDEGAEVRRFARDLVEGTCEVREALDREIQAVAQNWQISRMAVIDRNVLRMAAYEMLNSGDVPPKVAINEAIELGKRFSTQNSGAFINGILDRIKTRAQGNGNQNKAELGNSALANAAPAEQAAGDATSDGSA
jgi:transcription antitermination factor NusB